MTTAWRFVLVSLLACVAPGCHNDSSDHGKNGAPRSVTDTSQGTGTAGDAEGAATTDPAQGKDTSPGGPAAPATPTTPGSPGAAAPSPPPAPPGGAPPCVAPDGVLDEPRSIEDVIALVNALPMPVTLACYLEALKRPLNVSATTSQLSVQPAMSEQSPRIFLFSGSLVAAIVPEGDASHLLEMSVLTSNQISIKGEISFPVTAALPPDAAYKAIQRIDGLGTRCGGCHFGEAAAPSGTGAAAFSSKALRPFDGNDVPLDFLLRASAGCAGDASGRCQILRAIFEHGEVKPQAFPNDMGTLF